MGGNNFFFRRFWFIFGINRVIPSQHLHITLKSMENHTLVQNTSSITSQRNFIPLTSHICISLLYIVAAGVFQQYIRPSNVWIFIFQKKETLKKIWSNFEIDLRPLKFSPKNLTPLIFLFENLRPLKKHSERVFSINNAHPLRSDLPLAYRYFL